METKKGRMREKQKKKIGKEVGNERRTIEGKIEV